MTGVQFAARAETFFPRHRILTVSRAHPASCPMIIGAFFPGGEANGVWSWLFASI